MSAQHYGAGVAALAVSRDITSGHTTEEVGVALIAALAGQNLKVVQA